MKNSPVLFLLFALLLPGMVAAAQPRPLRISPEAARQIDALQREKEARTPVQRKIDSRLLYTMRSAALSTGVAVDERNRTVVDIKCGVCGEALARLRATDATVLDAVMHNIRAEVSLDQLETIAAWPETRFIRPKEDPVIMGAPGAPKSDAAGFLIVSEGERTHDVTRARRAYGTNGNGVKVGVISDGLSQWEQIALWYEVPSNLRILPGQEGNGSEGVAMLEILQDLAPGAQYYFATAYGGPARLAQNIRDLRAAGCDIIVDDVRYLSESPFHDGQPANLQSEWDSGIVAQAVSDVTADGALYFSSAGNLGNLTNGTSSVYEGDFADGGTSPLLPGGTLHAFSAGVTNNQLLRSGGSVFLFWADPLGASTNDYDLYLLDRTGTQVVAASTNVQDGSQDPIEALSNPDDSGFSAPGNRIVIFKKSGAQQRFVHLSAAGASMTYTTSGEIAGHAAVADAFAVAASPAVGPYPGVFDAASKAEPFTSDGPRRAFFNGDGTPYTPDNFTSSGGVLRQKPDFTAADGVSCATPGFSRFFGTSAAAPHAAAIAALIKSALPDITPSAVRDALIASAIDIEGPGVDRDTGAGIIMAPAALDGAGAGSRALVLLQDYATALTAESCPNGALDPDETVTMRFCFRNAGAMATFARVSLDATDGVANPSPAQDLLLNSNQSACRAFTFTVSGACGETIAPTLRLTESRSGGPRGEATERLIATLVHDDPPIRLGVPIGALYTDLAVDEMPAGWTTTTNGGGLDPWTVTPTGAFVLDAAVAGQSSLVSPPIAITSHGATVSFVHSFLTMPTEEGGGNLGDVGVLEIRVGDGEFQEIVAAGGTFRAGGYVAPNGWTGDTAWYGPRFPFGFPTQMYTQVGLPDELIGKTVQFRWRFTTDSLYSAEGGGWTIARVEVIGGYACCH